MKKLMVVSFMLFVAFFASLFWAASLQSELGKSQLRERILGAEKAGLEQREKNLLAELGKVRLELVEKTAENSAVQGKNIELTSQNSELSFEVQNLKRSLLSTEETNRIFGEMFTASQQEFGLLLRGKEEECFGFMEKAAQTVEKSNETLKGSNDSLQQALDLYKQQKTEYETLKEHYEKMSEGYENLTNRINGKVIIEKAVLDDLIKNQK